MIINGKISYQELEQLVFLLKSRIINSYIKKIYHYDNLWLFKFNHFSFVFEPGVAIWPGKFIEREKIIHSVGVKIRKEIGDTKVIDFNIIDNDRTIVLKLKNNFKIILELFAKGNLILLNENNTIVVLTRIYGDFSHGKIYPLDESDLKNFNNDYKLLLFNLNENNL